MEGLIVFLVVIAVIGGIIVICSVSSEMSEQRKKKEALAAVNETIVGFENLVNEMLKRAAGGSVQLVSEEKLDVLRIEAIKAILSMDEFKGVDIDGLYEKRTKLRQAVAADNAQNEAEMNAVLYAATMSQLTDKNKK